MYMYVRVCMRNYVNVCAYILKVNVHISTLYAHQTCIDRHGLLTQVCVYVHVHVCVCVCHCECVSP